LSIRAVLPSAVPRTLFNLNTVSFDKIPLELRLLTQWVPFQVGPELNGHGKPKKIPLIAGTDRMASVTDPSTWTTFEEACKWGAPALVITKELRLVFIDFDGSLDTPLAKQLWEAFPSYTEKSTSGNGWHILVAGTLPHRDGMRRGGVEVYTDRRFCIFTGDAIEGREEIIEGNTEFLLNLSEQMGKVNGYEKTDGEVENHPQVEDDEVVLEKCQRSEKFRKLWRGEWTNGTGPGEYDTQSAADHGLIGEVLRHTPNNEQAHRIFQKSALYRPDKPHKFKFSLKVIRANQAKEREADEFCQALMPLRLPESSADDFSQNDPALYTTLPEGLLRDMFEAFMAASFRPLKEASLIAALGAALALFQRNTQTHTRLALNMWLFVIGDSSDGKEMSSKGIRNLFRDAKAPMKGVLGGEIRSSPAVEDALKGSAGGSLRHVATHGECDGWIRSMCDDKASIGAQQMRSKLMESYTKGADSWALRQVKVAKGEEKEFELDRPCLTIIGDCVSSCFYESVGTSQAASGFLPRFSVLEVDVSSVSRKMNINESQDFPPALLDKVHTIASKAMEDDVANTFRRARITKEARKAFREYVEESWNHMLDNRLDKENALRGKLGEKVIKLATLCSVCRNHDDPEVNMADLEWAKLFVKVTDGRMMYNLAAGEYDPAMHRQRKIVRDRLDQACRISKSDRQKQRRYFPSEKLQADLNACTYGWLRDRVDNVACFVRDRQGVGPALFKILRDLETSGEIVLVNGDKAREDYGCKSAVILNLREPEPRLKLF